MTFGQMPNGSLVDLQMPLYSVVGGSEIVIEPPVPEIDTNPGMGSVLGNFREEDEMDEENPEWKERSYRELKETIEILTMVGFFD